MSPARFLKNHTNNYHVTYLKSEKISIVQETETQQNATRFPIKPQFEKQNKLEKQSSKLKYFFDQQKIPQIDWLQQLGVLYRYTLQPSHIFNVASNKMQNDNNLIYSTVPE